MTALMSLKEVARMVAKSEVTLRALARSGTIEATKDASGAWLVDPNHVVAHFGQSKNAHNRISNRQGASSKTAQSPQPIDVQSPLVDALQSQIRLLERQLEHTQGLLSDEKAARNRLEQDMTAILREIRAMMEGKNSENVLTRFFRR